MAKLALLIGLGSTLLVTAAACSGGSGQKSDSNGPSGDPEVLAARAFDALVTGNEIVFRSLLRPAEPRDDEYTRGFPSSLSRALEGCNLAGSRIEVQGKEAGLGDGFMRAVVTFEQPCGSDASGLAFKACTAPLLVRKGGNWYLDSNSYHCSH